MFTERYAKKTNMKQGHSEWNNPPEHIQWAFSGESERYDISHVYVVDKHARSLRSPRRKFGILAALPEHMEEHGDAEHSGVDKQCDIEADRENMHGITDEAIRSDVDDVDVDYSAIYVSTARSSLRMYSKADTPLHPYRISNSSLDDDKLPPIDYEYLDLTAGVGDLTSHTDTPLLEIRPTSTPSPAPPRSNLTLPYRGRMPKSTLKSIRGTLSAPCIPSNSASHTLVTNHVPFVDSSMCVSHDICEDGNGSCVDIKEPPYPDTSHYSHHPPPPPTPRYHHWNTSTSPTRTRPVVHAESSQLMLSILRNPPRRVGPSLHPYGIDRSTAAGRGHERHHEGRGRGGRGRGRGGGNSVCPDHELGNMLISSMKSESPPPPPPVKVTTNTTPTRTPHAITHPPSRDALIPSTGSAGSVSPIGQTCTESAIPPLSPSKTCPLPPPPPPPPPPPRPLSPASAGKLCSFAPSSLF